MPRVSLLMATVDNGALMARSVDSLLAQTYSDFELIFIGSNPPAGSSIRLNTVETGTFREGLAAATGEVVGWVRAGDAFSPNRLSLQLAAMDANPQIGVVGTFTNLLDASGRTADILRTETHHNLIAWSLPFVAEPLVSVTTALMQRALVEQLNGTELDDAQLGWHLLPQTQFMVLPEALCSSRGGHLGADANARLAVLEALLDQPLDQEGRWLVQTGEVSPGLKVQQAELVTGLILATFEAMDAQGFFIDENRGMLRAALIERLVQAAQNTTVYDQLIADGDNRLLALRFWQRRLPDPWWRLPFWLLHPMYAMRRH
ncbi:MAG: glycosyltransferase family 2 protein [Chloroflexi bacterium]|nr:glycosyltransferase family 2 protein [Chloroflexota bacterium]